MNKNELINILLKKGWDKTNIELGIRANCECEYCGKNLLKSIDNYKLWQIDHIIPKCSNYENVESIDNKALSCVQCNKDFKGRWNPAEKLGFDKKREEYISEVIEYVKQKRRIKQEELTEIQNTFKKLLG